MTPDRHPTAVIAEDEPVLARTLTRLLEQAWPELRIIGVAEDGLQATELTLAKAPDVVFLDIKMPGRNGIDVAKPSPTTGPTATPSPCSSSSPPMTSSRSPPSSAPRWTTCSSPRRPSGCNRPWSG